MSTFLQLPTEIRLKLYSDLFVNTLIQVELEYSDGENGPVKPRMKAVPKSAQLIRVCKQIYQEASVHLYSSNIFDCSQREGIKLLLQSIGPKNFSMIKHIRTDWDELQSISWALAKEEYKEAMRGLRCLEIANWRTRTLGGSSFLWRQAKSYERQLCESALNICLKHPTLKVVVQKAYHRSGRAGAQPTDIRVKWRFITTADDLTKGEIVISPESDLLQLDAGKQSDDDREPNLTIDAF